MQNDHLFLKKTFKLAAKGSGLTSPNPMVGAVIVRKGRVLSSGFHRKAGSVHAEIDALNKIKGNVRGATLYVNLEPCCIWGRTPPCVDRIISSGIKKVVISTLDPNPAVRGRSVKKMRSAGISVETGILAEEGRRLNEVFFKNMEKKLPFVAVKSAFSLDGKTVTAGGQSQWITGESARGLGRTLRDKYDAVCVGICTVLKDDPGLEASLGGKAKIIIDPHLKIPLKSRLLKNSENRVFILTSAASRAKKNKLACLEKQAKIVVVPYGRSGFSPETVLKRLYKLGICSIYLEGGAYTSGAFFDACCVDKIYFFIAPLILGGTRALPVLGGKGVKQMKDAVEVADLKVKKVGPDLLIEGYPRYKAPAAQKVDSL